MRRALVVGINHYPKIGNLYGCVNDARAIAALLERNADGAINFGVRPMIAEDDRTAVSRDRLEKQ